MAVRHTEDLQVHAGQAVHQLDEGICQTMVVSNPSLRGSTRRRAQLTFVNCKFGFVGPLRRCHDGQ